MTTAIIDGDLICHHAAAACEDRYIEVILPNNSYEIFDNRTALKAYCLENEMDYSQCDIEDCQFPEPIEVINYTAEKMAENWAKKVKADEYEIFIGLEKTFRNRLPLPEEYKGQRSASLKAVHVDDVKHHLLGLDNCTEATQGLESDDWLAIRAYEGFQRYKKSRSNKDKVVQITIDKDALGTTGFTFNPDKMMKPLLVKGLGEIELFKKSNVWNITGHGTKFLMYQMLCGDTVDNYSPTKHIKKRFGPTNCGKLLLDLDTPEDCWKAVVDQYKAWFGDNHKYTSWDGQEIECDWLYMLQLYFDVARMRRWPDDDLQIKEVLDKYGIE